MLVTRTQQNGVNKAVAMVTYYINCLKKGAAPKLNPSPRFSKDLLNFIVLPNYPLGQLGLHY